MVRRPVSGVPHMVSSGQTQPLWRLDVIRAAMNVVAKSQLRRGWQKYGEIEGQLSVQT